MSDLKFKHETEDEIDSVLELNQTSSSEILFNILHINQAIKNLNKSSAPGPNRITVELVENGGEQLFHYLTHLMPASCFLRYFPKPWKKENYTNLKKSDKESYHLENSYCSISLSSICAKIYERIILQQATNILEENSFFKGKNLYAYQKNKNASQALLPLIEQMCEGVASGKYGIADFADMQGAFNAVWSKGALISCTKQV